MSAIDLTNPDEVRREAERRRLARSGGRPLALADIGFGEAAPVRATLALPEPPSANRWWRMVVVKGQARMLTSKEARDYKDRVAQLGGRNKMPEGPVRLTIDWYREWKWGDLDKRIGVLLDALQGVLYSNDSQIVEITARRHDDPGNPRVVVTAEAL